MKIAAALVIVGSLVGGCQPSAETQQAEARNAIPLAAQKTPTVADWTAALNSTFITSNEKDDGDGATEFFACFEQKKKCESFAFGRRDAFQKIRVFEAGYFSHGDVTTYLKTSVFLPDNKLPRIVLQPYFFGKNSGLFLSKSAIMADGEIILERSFEKDEVDRRNTSYGIEERANVFVSQAEVERLRTMATSKVVLIRLIGSKGYIALKADEVKNVRKEVANALFIYDKLTAALSENLPPASPADK